MKFPIGRTAVAVLVMAAVAACTGDSDATATGTPTASGTATAAATSVGTPAATGTATATGTGTATAVATGTAEPTAELVDGLPREAVGPLAVFVKPRMRGTVLTPTSPTEVSVVDLVSGRVVSRWEVGGPSVRVTVLGLAGTELVVWRSGFQGAEIEGGIVRHDLAGRVVGTLLEDRGGNTVINARLSSDGSRLAVAQRASGCDEVCTLLIDVARGEVLQRIRQATSALGELGGQFPDPIAWRGDGSGVLVAGQPNGHAFFGWATAFTDGSVRVHELDGSPRPGPDGRYVLSVSDDVADWEEDAIGCQLYGTVRLHDLERDAVLATFGPAGSAHSGARWSPDGGKVLLGWRALPAPGGVCTEVYAAWSEQPAEWVLVETGSGAATAAPDPAAIEHGWFPEPRLSLRCDGEEPEIGLSRISACEGDAPVEVVAGDVVIDSGREVRVIGSLELSPEQVSGGFLRAVIDAGGPDPSRVTDAWVLLSEALVEELEDRYLDAPAFITLSLLLSGPLAIDHPPETFSVVSVSGEGERAAVTVDLSYANRDGAARRTIDLERDAGVWRIAGVE